MPSEKGKDNKSLVVMCAACAKPVSTESAVALMGAEDGRRKQSVVCVICANAGWRPPGFAGLYSTRPR
ncbi:MAG: hypothetical protein ACYDC3_14820 [Candidatus Binataceae bacterium]